MLRTAILVMVPMLSIFVMDTVQGRVTFFQALVLDMAAGALGFVVAAYLSSMLNSVNLSELFVMDPPAPAEWGSGGAGGGSKFTENSERSVNSEVVVEKKADLVRRYLAENPDASQAEVREALPQVSRGYVNRVWMEFQVERVIQAMRKTGRDLTDAEIKGMVPNAYDSTVRRIRSQIRAMGIETGYNDLDPGKP